MKISKFGWLAALVALAAVVGAVAFTGKAEAAITGATKSCLATVPVNTYQCTLTVTTDITNEGPAPQTYTVSMTGPGTFGTVTGTTNVAGCTVTVTPTGTTTYNFTVNGAACNGVGETITLTEAVTVTATGTLTETVVHPFSGTSASASAAVTFTPPAPVVPSSVTQSCTPPAVPGNPPGTAVVGTPVPCTLTITFPTAPATAQSGTITVTNGTLNSPAGGSFTCPAGSTTCTVSESVTPTTAGVIPSKTVVIAGTTFTPAFTGITAVVATGTFTTTMHLESVPGSNLCPASINFPLVSPPTGVNPLGPIDLTCFIDIDDNSPTPELVSSGVVNVTVGSPGQDIVVSIAFPSGIPPISGAVAGATSNVRCGAPNTLDSCDGVVVVITVRASNAVALPNVQTIQITANYVPDNPAVNTPAALAATTAFTVRTEQVVAPVVEATALIITCVSNVTPAANITSQFPTPLTPGQLPGSIVGTPLAVGVLPGAVSCVAQPAVPAGTPTSTNPSGCPAGSTSIAGTGFCAVAIAPGTIEVSSISGSILTLSGTLSTNVRIPCGSTLVNFPTTVGGVININNCTGVRFSVLGLGVGNVEIRARYEPAPDFGQSELEGSGFVSFVAPAVGVSLTLNPDPVGVGQTGTATAFLNQLFIPNCGTVACVDPATGLPITVGANPGSVLNGIVIFTIADTAIARFNEPILSATSITAASTTTLNTGVFATANQVAKLCGAFSGGTTAVFTNIGGASTPLAPFFGGCTQVSTTYVGVNPGTTQIAATFVPFLPGVTSLTSAISGSTSGFALGPGFQTFNFFAPGIGPASTFRVLQVAGAAPATTQNLVPGCNNVVAPANETVAQVIARVDPSSAVISVAKQVPGTVQFQIAAGPASGNVPAGVSNLSSVNALDAIFICVNARATYRISVP